MTYDDFFSRATGGRTPYPYQRHLATADMLNEVLSVPTGVGKTAAVILAWLFRRRSSDKQISARTPRRLVYCLPMRTLVTQTESECRKWLQNLDIASEVDVHKLMGGEDQGSWDESPERDAILIGTQDMLLSRALNRGYGMSRYRWPVHFALLNNDCLWVMDETQLMGVGLTTTVQLAGLRKKLNTYLPGQSLWMSATLDSSTLTTVDHDLKDSQTNALVLGEDDMADERVQQLLKAQKPLQRATVSLSKDSEKKYASDLATEVVNAHQQKTLTLVIVNTVDRAQRVFESLRKAIKGDNDTPETVLIHSRFRAGDRQLAQTAAFDETTIPEAGRIIIATQAIEAGVDLSATTMFTELAPWSSLVQRFGRCNRRGECGIPPHAEANVFWIDVETGDGKSAKFTAPYDSADLDISRSAISSLSDVGPQSIAQVSVTQEQPLVQVLRRKDLIDLFDTTPDLTGRDLDISRFIRDSDDTDVQFYWRSWDLKKASGRPPLDRSDESDPAFPAPSRDELCSVSLPRARDLIDKLKKPLAAWAWDALDRAWQPIRKNDVHAGMVILLHIDAGGYETQIGYTGDTKHKPTLLAPPDNINDMLASMDDDDTAGGGAPLSITQHLRDVAHFAAALRADFGESQIPWDAVTTSAAWHDVGKAHEAFQTAMRDALSACSDIDPDSELWAKSGTRGVPRYRIEPRQPSQESNVEPSENKDVAHNADTPESISLPTEIRRGFRHELASALAWLHHCSVSKQVHPEGLNVDLVAYLIAAHHGKVRLSIRSMPNEIRPREPNRRFARGIWEGDVIPAVELQDGNTTTELQNINLDLMNIGDSPGSQSWLTRMLTLRDSQELGPFRLSFLELLVRVSDWRGSANPGMGGSK